MSEMRFGFGRNWENYIRLFYSEERVNVARSNLLKTLRLEDLRGKTFLDIGCGSGIHSLAAVSAGAERVLSFDYDPYSVRTTASIHERHGKPNHWTVLQGSALDADFVRSLGKFDIVYSWGVLHHTGDTSTAITNATLPLHENSVFLIALYSHTAYLNNTIWDHPTPEEWMDIKKRYNSASILIKRFMEYHEAWRVYFKPYGHTPADMLRSFRKFRALSEDYRKNRGMDIWIDLRDWLGGWPMDFVKEREINTFCQDELGLEFLDMRTGEGNTEFLFRPKGATNYWDKLLDAAEWHTVKGPFLKYGAHCWAADMPELEHLADTNQSLQRSPFLAYEDQEPLSFAHTPERAVCLFGEGRYLHKDNVFIFSSSDGTDPNGNGRSYRLRSLEPSPRSTTRQDTGKNELAGPHPGPEAQSQQAQSSDRAVKYISGLSRLLDNHAGNVVVGLPDDMPLELAEQLASDPRVAFIFADEYLFEALGGRFPGKIFLAIQQQTKLPVSLPKGSIAILCYSHLHVRPRIALSFLLSKSITSIYHYAEYTLRGFTASSYATFAAQKLLESKLKNIPRFAKHKLRVALAAATGTDADAPALVESDIVVLSHHEEERHISPFTKALSNAPLLPATCFKDDQIQLVSGSLGGGGAERQVTQTLIGLKSRGYSNIHLVCDKLDNPACTFFEECLTECDIHPEQVCSDLDSTVSPALRRYFSQYTSEASGGEWSWRMFVNYAQEFYRRRPGIVHVWQEMPYVALAAALVGVPRIAISWRSLSPQSVPSIYNPLLVPAYRLLTQKPNVHFCSNSFAGRADYADWLGIDESRISVIHNGFNLEEWKLPTREEILSSREEFGISETTLVVGSVFRFVEEKDPLLWIRTAVAIAAQKPETLFVIFGDGPYRQEMEKLASAANLNIRMPGTTTDTAASLRVLDVFLLTSIIEGTPNVNIEAQILGLPVVTTAAGGAADTVEHGRSGFVVQNRAPESIAAKVLELLDNDELRAAMSQAARPAAEERFGLDRMLDETLALYGLSEKAEA